MYSKLKQKNRQNKGKCQSRDSRDYSKIQCGHFKSQCPGNSSDRSKGKSKSKGKALVVNEKGDDEKNDESSSDDGAFIASALLTSVGNRDAWVQDSGGYWTNGE
jgi:hypothetical protein